MKWNPLLKSQIYYQPRASMVQPKELQLHHGTEYTQGNKARQGKEMQGVSNKDQTN